MAVVAIIIGAALKMANTWEKFVILRAGKLRSVKGPAVIDERIQTTAFSAEAALTKDSVPVNVDAIIFWFVHDAQKAALNITNYREAIDRVAQTSLREMIGSSMLAALLSERTAADDLLRSEIGRKTADWGISVKSVEIRDVAIPVALQDAMSRQAQAEREKQARVILGSSLSRTRKSFEWIFTVHLSEAGFCTSFGVPSSELWHWTRRRFCLAPGPRFDSIKYPIGE